MLRLPLLAVLQQHLNHLLQITLQLIEALCLRMGTGKTGNIADVKTGIRTALDHCGVGFHTKIVVRCDFAVKTKPDPCRRKSTNYTDDMRRPCRNRYRNSGRARNDPRVEQEFITSVN